MFDHITIRASDRTAAESFYDTVLRTVGVARSGRDEQYTVWGGDFSLASADNRNTVTRRLHIGFVAPSRVHVDAFWQAGVGAGYPRGGRAGAGAGARGGGEPGPRPEYSPDYYGGFLLDPDGNSVEAVHHGGTRAGRLDHMWIRVADLAATREFYETIAPYSKHPLLWEHPNRVHFGSMGDHFAIAEEAPHTANLHLAFAADSNEVVDAFHAAALAAG